MDRTGGQQGTPAEATLRGSKDGRGAGDHDVAFRFGYQPSHRWTYPFSIAQYSRLLIMRGRVQDGEFDGDRVA